MKTFKLILKELRPIFELIAAILLGAVVFPLGLLHNLIKPFYDYRERVFAIRLYLCIRYYFKMVYHIWRVVRSLIHELAKGLDILGNVVGGEAIEDLITYKEKTYFGNGNYTISAATGHVVYCYQKGDKKALNKTGIWFDKALNKAFNEEQHAVWSYEREMLGDYSSLKKINK